MVKHGVEAIPFLVLVGRDPGLKPRMKSQMGQELDVVVSSVAAGRREVDQTARRLGRLGTGRITRIVRAHERPAGPILEPDAVGEAGEVVVLGDVRQALLGAYALYDLPDRARYQVPVALPLDEVVLHPVLLRLQRHLVAFSVGTAHPAVLRMTKATYHSRSSSHGVCPLRRT